MTECFWCRERFARRERQVKVSYGRAAEYVHEWCLDEFVKSAEGEPGSLPQDQNLVPDAEPAWKPQEGVLEAAGQVPSGLEVSAMVRVWVAVLAALAWVWNVFRR